MLQNELVEIVESIWDAAVGGSISRTADAPNALASGSTYTARIDITGAWSGSLWATCTEGMVRSIAASMFACPLDTSSTEDLNDAIGEIVNIIGGNVKALLPAPCGLSLPAIETSSNGADPRDDATALYFDSNGQILRLEVSERLGGVAR